MIDYPVVSDLLMQTQSQVLKPRRTSNVLLIVFEGGLEHAAVYGLDWTTIDPFLYDLTGRLAYKSANTGS